MTYSRASVNDRRTDVLLGPFSELFRYLSTRLFAGSCVLARSVLLLSAIWTNTLFADSWDVLRGLNVRDHVRVVETSGRARKGEFRSMSGDGISIATRKGEITIARAHIRRVQLRSGLRRIRNTLIGGAIGLAVGVTVDHTLGTRLRNEGADIGRGITYALPVAIFGGIGAALPTYRTIYSAP